MEVRIPRLVLYALGAVVAIAATVGITLAVSGGDDNGDGERVATVTVESGATGENGEVESSELGAQPPADEVEDNSCDALGINSEGLKEGTCFQGKTENVVANRDSLLELDQLEARLGEITTTEVLNTGLGSPEANGVFVLVNLSITNTTSRPQMFDSGADLTTLYLCKDVYSQDFNASNNPGINSFVWSSSEIQPNQTKDGVIIFDIPAEAVKCLEKDGNVGIMNFRDEFSYGRPSQLGVFRTYH